MKLLVFGVLVGVTVYAVSCWGGRALDRYAEPKIPPYVAPRNRYWNGGVEVG